MRILIDGDACPVVKITEKIAKNHQLEMLIFTDITHQIKSNYARVISLDQANQSVDMSLYNKCRKNDIVITQDYGLAALVLTKGAFPLNSYGKKYNEQNIDHLLMKRHLHAKMRKAGKRHPTHKKRSKKDDQMFKKSLQKLLKNRPKN